MQHHPHCLNAAAGYSYLCIDHGCPTDLEGLTHLNKKEVANPTHVMVAKITNCLTCLGKGFGKGSPFPTTVCPECKGEKFTQFAMTLEDFAKLPK